MSSLTQENNKVEYLTSKDQQMDSAKQLVKVDFCTSQKVTDKSTKHLTEVEYCTP